MTHEKTNEEINKIITEKLFDHCWHEFQGREYCLKCGGRFTAGVLKTLRTEVYNFCDSDSAIREAREKIAEKGLQNDFVNALMEEVIPVKDRIKSIGGMSRLFNVINAEPIQQARAIVRVLEGLE